MRPVKRVLKLVAGVVTFGVYVWFSAVRNVPEVRRRKAARRRRDAMSRQSGT